MSHSIVYVTQEEDRWVASLTTNIMNLLRLLVRNNAEIQALVFDSLDVIMAVRSCPEALADMLCEVATIYFCQYEKYKMSLLTKLACEFVSVLRASVTNHQIRYNCR